MHCLLQTEVASHIPPGTDMLGIEIGHNQPRSTQCTCVLTESSIPSVCPVIHLPHALRACKNGILSSASGTQHMRTGAAFTRISPVILEFRMFLQLPSILMLLQVPMEQPRNLFLLSP